MDAVRGAAVLLMVLDHVLHQVEPQSSLRAGAPWSITRLSLPLFMLAAAAVWSAPHRGRVLRLGGVAVVEAVLYAVLDMPWPGIVAQILGVSLLLGAVRVVGGREPCWYLIGVLGFLQALYVPIGWPNYEPGLVLGWFCLARLALDRPGFVVTSSTLRNRALEAVGRRPLVWYLGHLVALVVTVSPHVGVLN